MVPLNVDTMLLLVGLVLLLVNVIIGAILLRRGRVRAGLLNVLLALGACAVIAVGLVGFAFSTPIPVAAAAFQSGASGTTANGSGSTTGTNRGAGGAGRGSPAIQTQIAEGTIPAPLQTATAGGGSGGANAVGTAPANGTTAGGNGNRGGGGRGAIQTQIAEGTIPAPLQTSVAAGTPLSAALAGRGGGRPAGGGGTPAATEEPTTAPTNANAGNFGGGNAAGGSGTRGAGGFGGGTATTATAGTVAGLPFNLFVQIATVIGGIITVATGLALFLAERDRENFNPSASGGLLNMGAGAFVIVAAIVIPILPAQFTGGTRVNAAGAANVAARVAARSVQTATPTDTLVPTGTPSPMPSLTPAPSQTPVILVTQVAFGGTPMSTATTCILTTKTIAYLRGDPSAKKASIANIFPGSLLQVLAQSTDKQWWQVIYTDNGTSIEGWVDNQFVTADSACNDGSVALVGPTATPTRTPRPSSTPLPTSGGANTTAANKPGGTCTVTTTVAVSVRPDPSLQQAPIAQVPERTAMLATEKTANGWYHVQYSSTGNGWVGAGAVFAERACDSLTVVAAP